VSVLFRADRTNASRAARSKGAWKSYDQLMLTLIFLLYGVGQVSLSFAALALGRPSAPPEIQGIATPALARELIELNLLNLLGAWLLVPLFARGLLVRGRSLSLSHLLQYPVSVRQALAFSALSTLTSGTSIGMLLMTLLALVPLVGMPHAIAALTGAAFFVAAAVSMSWAIGVVASALLSMARGRAIALGLASACLLLAATPAIVSPQRMDDGMGCRVLGREILLLSRDGSRGLLHAVSRASPARAVATLGYDGLRPGPLGLLVGLAATSALAAALGFRRSLLHPPEAAAPRRARMFSAAPFTNLPFVRDPLRALAEKELMFLLQTMDAALVAILGIVAAIVALRAQAYWWIALVLLPFMAISEAAMPTNAFGLDRGGVDRYLLAPVTATQVLLSKNIAWIWLIAWQSLPVVLALGARMGARVALAAVAGQGAYVLFATAWGNIVSVSAPAPREFWNFDSPQQTGGMVSQLALILAGAALGAAWLGAAQFDGTTAPPRLVLPITMLGLSLIGVFAWLASLRWAARELGRHPEQLRERLVA
jgi:hypothetical protein